MTKETGYTTKPIELPLSTEKEYVLVDVDGYSKNNHPINTNIVSDGYVTSPFNLTRIDDCGDGYCIKGLVIQVSHKNEHKFFHEVIRNADTKTETPEEKEALDSMANNSELPDCNEWDGEGLPPVGVECEWCGTYGGYWVRCEVVASSDNQVVVKNTGEYKPGTFEVKESRNTKFRPLETPEQKAERERIDNGKAFYEMSSSIEVSVLNPEDHGYPNPWDELRGEWQEIYIKIAEKVGYRKNA